MKGVLLALCVVGTVLSSLASKHTLALKFNRSLTGNECVGHEHGDHIPYPGDCEKFLVCEYNHGTVMTCPSGLHFNPNLGLCDWPTSAGCTGGNIPPIETTTKLPNTPPNEPPTEPSMNPTISTTTQTPIEPSTDPSNETVPTVSPDDNVCIGKEDGYLVPYPYDCKWYIRCEDSSPSVLRCKKGKVFNAILLICDYPENVNCVDIPYPIRTTTDPPTETTTQSIMTTTEPPTETTTHSITTTTDPSTETTSQSITTTTEPPTEISTESITTTAEPPTDPTTVSTSVSTDSTTDLSTLPTPQEVDPTPTPGTNLNYCSNQPNNAFLPYPCSCSWYIRCQDNCAHIEPCKNGQIFNNALKICDFPENTECVEAQYPPIVTPTEPSIELPPSTTTTGSDQGSTNLPYEGTGICQNIERGTLLPYPGRCDLYIECIEPVPTTFSCPTGMEFDSDAGQCLKIEEAGCSVPRVTSEVTTTTEATITHPPSEIGICASYPIDDLIPYPGNCSQYIHCTRPIPTAQECPTGLEFNAELKICESSQDAGCSSKPVQPPTPESPITPSTPSEGVTICTGLDDNELVSYPGDCTKFIICEHPIPSASCCDSGLIFNPDLNICDEPTDSECVTSTPTPPIKGPSDPTMTGICKGHQKGELVAYPDNCTKYIRCSAPAPVAETCKNDKPFNEILGICDTTNSGVCPGFNPTPEPGEGPTTNPPLASTNGICEGHKLGDVLPYPGQCNKFIHCQIPVPYARTCEKGYHFNANLSICDDPETAGCEAFVIPTPESPSSTSNICCGAPIDSLVPYPDDCTQYIQCLYPIPKALQCEDGLHYNSVSQVCESIESAACQWYTTTTIAPITCEDKVDGTVFAYREDCKRYYYCSEGEAVLLDCTIGAVFDETVGNCVPGDECP